MHNFDVCPLQNGKNNSLYYFGKYQKLSNLGKSLPKMILDEKWNDID